MATLKKAIKKTTFCRYNENEEIVLEKSIPFFKKNFSKEVKELWNMLDEPQDGMTESDLLKKLGRVETVINKLKSDIYEFQLYYS
jgi:hypothetical protein